MTTTTKTIYVECKDDTPPSGLGSMEYPDYIKEETKDNLYMKMPINDGVLIMVQLPIILTGTRFFKMVEIGTIFKFMDIEIAKGKGNFVDFMGADHCNQTEPQKVYSLVEFGVDDLTKIIATTKAQSQAQVEEEDTAAAKEAEIIAKRGPAIKIKYKNQEMIILYSTPPAETTIGWVKEQFRSLIPEELRNGTIRFLHGGRILRDDAFISILGENTVISAMVSPAPLPPAPPGEEGDAKGFNKHRKSKKHNRKSKKHNRKSKKHNRKSKKHNNRRKTMRVI
jgi:hypothetical protein